VGTLAAVVVLEIVTGGAITAFLPVLMQFLMTAMNASAVVAVAKTLADAAGYIGQYLSKGWQKLVEPASIALATAMAMGLVELAMELGFKGLGKGLKKAGAAVKKGATAAAKGAKNAASAGVRSVKSLLKSGATLASKSGSMIIRNGKVVIKSLQKGFTKGVTKLKGLLGKILNRFKFKRFELERQKEWIILYGVFNPRLKIAKASTRNADELLEQYEKLMEEAARKQPKYQRKLNKPRNYKSVKRTDDGGAIYTFTSAKNGLDYQIKYDADGFPVFNSKQDLSLPESYYLEPDDIQFEYLSKELFKKIESDKNLAQKFTAEEIALLKKGKVPETLTWHHHQDTGKMQIVDYFEHQVAGHTGGRAIWGGGRAGRKGKIKRKIAELIK
uniref:HNH endonuclease n=1 Tax=Paenibacillus tepidiphilus TaxID=2608683 RepID=UPI001EF06121